MVSQELDMTEAQEIISRALVEAKALGHDYVGAEHLLLAPVADPESSVAKVLANVRVKPNRVRAAVEFITGRRREHITPGKVTLSPRTVGVIETALEEAKRLGSDRLKAEHLLLGLIHEEGTIAHGIIRNTGETDLFRLRDEIVASIKTNR